MKYKILLIIGLLLFPSVSVRGDVGDTFYGVEVLRHSNYLNPNTTAFPFDGINFGLPSMWNAAQPTRITIPIDGVWVVGADTTALGLNYSSIGGKDSSRVILAITKNWCGQQSQCPYLFATICWERFEVQNLYGANGNNVSCIVELKQGDYLELVTTGKDPAGLLIESNPNNTGMTSPHFYAYHLGSP